MSYNELLKELTYAAIFQINPFEQRNIESYKKYNKNYCRTINSNVFGLSDCDTVRFYGNQYKCNNFFNNRDKNNNNNIRIFINDLNIQVFNAERYRAEQKKYCYQKSFKIDGTVYTFRFVNDKQIQKMLNILTVLTTPKNEVCEEFENYCENISKFLDNVVTKC